MAIFPTTTELAAADVDAGTAFPCSKSSARNEILADDLLDGILRVASSAVVNYRPTDYSTPVYTFAADPTSGYSYNGGNLLLIQSGVCGLILTASLKSFRVPSDWLYCWASTTTNLSPPDTALARPVAKVVSITDGSTAGGTLSSVPLSPSQITSNQNDYAPGVARYYRLTTDASRTITGLSCSQVTGQECEIWNVGSFNIILAHQSGSSTAANRFINQNSLDLTILPGEVAYLRYDGTTARWRVIPESPFSNVEGFATITGASNIFSKPVLTFGTPGSNAPSLIGNTGSNLIQFYNATGVTPTAIDCGAITSNTTITAGASSFLTWSGRSLMASPSDGVIRVTASSGTVGAAIASIPRSPAQITSNQNDYAPGVAHTYRLTADAARDITGLSIGQVDGQWGRIFNVGSNAITLKHQSASSTAANRFLNVTGADVVLAADEGAEFEYDSTTARFRVWKL